MSILYNIRDIIHDLGLKRKEKEEEKTGLIESCFALRKQL